MSTRNFWELSGKKQPRSDSSLDDDDDDDDDDDELFLWYGWPMKGLEAAEGTWTPSIKRVKVWSFL